MSNDPREAKLPKWTQELLATLRRDLDNLTADFEEYADKEMPDDAIAVANPYDEHPRLAARKGEEVRFTLPRGEYIEISIDTYDGALVVRASRPVDIRPTASNHLTLSVPRD